MADRAPLTLAVAYPSAEPRALTGEVELALEHALGLPLRPDRVTGVLSAMFSRIGGAEVSRQMLERLTSGARAWLLARAAQVFLPGAHWFQASCGTCGQDYDLRLSLSDLPRAPKPEEFPVVAVDTSLGPRRFEVPNGYVERRLANADPRDAAKCLASETGLSDDAHGEAARMTDADLAAIERALDAASPDISEEVLTACPVCTAATSARVDPLDFAFPQPGRLLSDIHILAKGYGWTEAEILALPSARRRTYARLLSSEARP